MIWLLSVVIFVASSTTLAFALCEFFGSLSLLISVISLVLGAILGSLTFFKFKSEFKSENKFSYFDWLMILLFMIFSFRHFLWLIFRSGNSVLTLDLSNYGDLPKHITYLNYLARGAHFWPGHPLLTGAPFTYHFGVDLFSAMFTKLGVPFLNYLPVMGFIAAILLVVALMNWGGGFTLGAFLFAGGGLGYSYFFTHQLRDYQQGKPWASVIMYLFATQRGFLYALPAGLLLLWSWRRRFLTNGSEKPLPMYIEGFLWGTMPLFQIHTFLFISFVYSWWFLTTRNYKSVIILAWALVPASIEVYLVTDHFRRTSLMWWNPGWMIKDENIFLFLWNNYGLFLPLAIGAFVIALKKGKSSSSWRQLAPAVSMFIICFFITFQPWDWDNIKLFMWSYILSLPLMYELVLKRFSKTAQALSIIALFIPGFISILAMHNPQNKGTEIYSRSTVDAVCNVLKNVDPDARVATAMIHNHPVLICGQPIILGYTGVLWGEGLKYGEIEAQLRTMMLGAANWHQLAHDLKARYLFWGPNEASMYAGSSRPWEAEHVKILAQGPWGTIYDLGTEENKQ